MPPLTFFQPGAQPGDTSQRCPICGKGVPESPRYPDYVCDDCYVTATDNNGRKLDFYNTNVLGGYEALFPDTGEPYHSHVCYIRGVECYADEARFGGIVIRPKQPSES
jgi:hypothetical protein